MDHAHPQKTPRASLGDSFAHGFDDDSLPSADWGRRRGGPRRAGTVWLFALFILTLAAGKTWLSGDLFGPAALAWFTIFVAISLQALPFLVFGIALSAALAAFVPAHVWHKILPRNAAASVPIACSAGLALPGCECASVPLAGGLIRRGIAPAAALTFLLAAPAINPIVLVATAVAFAGQPEMVLGRFVASFAAAILVGWVWARFGRTEWIKLPHQKLDLSASKGRVFVDSMRHDLLHAGGFLVVGAMAAATLNVTVPRDWLVAVAEQPVMSVLMLAMLAMLLSICSEADAFVAASLTDFSPTAQLAFMVVGPMVDLKLIALQAGTFGWEFVKRFVPITLGSTLLFTFLVGWWLF